MDESVLDYHLTDMECSELTVVDTDIPTDHKLVTCIVTPPLSEGGLRDIRADVLKSNLGSRGAVDIMMNSRWPKEPFIRVAKAMNMCRIHKSCPDEAHTLVANYRTLARNAER